MFDLHRRALLGGALSAAAIPFAARAQAWPRTGFTHNVASGEPGTDRVLLWTRYVHPRGRAARLTVQLSETEDFARIAARGEGEAAPGRDYGAKVEVGGLKPGRWYWYRFRAPGGELSPVGRTKTLPEGRPERFTVAVFSCSNLPFGFFNAYAHAAARDDIDLWLHVGDYTYEYERGRYPRADEALPERPIWPEGETVRLDDYRQRLATYRADPDLQALHARIPCLAQWDDHELTNDAWTGGAQNHQSETEGTWPDRLKAASAAYFEWLPMQGQAYSAYEVGDLLSLYRLETRVTGRDRQLNYNAAMEGVADRTAAARAFRDGPWADPKRSVLGAEQEAWLARELLRSAGDGTRWQFVMQQVLTGWLFTPPAAPGWVTDATPAAVRARVENGALATGLGFPNHMDSWSGYPAAKARLLDAARGARANLVMCAGDSHNAWAFELGDAKAPAGVEFGTTSVSAPGFESQPLRVTPPEFARALIAASPELKWCDTSRRGYMTISFTRDRVEAKFHFMETVRRRSTVVSEVKTVVTERGTNRLVV